MEDIEIREELPEDADSIREVNERAFGQPQEARLVDALRRSCPDLLSLVALKDGAILGHILFTPVLVEGPAETFSGRALGPMAVIPQHQKRGLGTALVQAGIQRLKAIGFSFIIVVGHPAYYPRFGFKPAREQGILCPWDVPDEAFMILTLRPSEVKGMIGVVRYRPEFSLEL